jgi:hypothetical protein
MLAINRNSKVVSSSTLTNGNALEVVLSLHLHSANILDHSIHRFSVIPEQNFHRRVP